MEIVIAELVSGGITRQLKSEDVVRLLSVYRDSRFLSLHSYDSGLYEAFVCKLNGVPVRHAVYVISNGKLDAVVNSDIKLCDVLNAGDSVELLWLSTSSRYSVKIELKL